MDNNRKPETCALCCSEYSQCNFEEIVEDTKGILNVLLLQIDASESRPMMCEYCSIKVKIFYAFKSACIRTENFITPFVDQETRNQVDLKQLYIREKKEKGQGEPLDTLSDRNLCRLCMGAIDKGCLYLNGSDCHVNAVKIFMQKCIPELDVSNTLDPVVCDDCIDLLKSYCEFLDSCAVARIQKTIKNELQANGNEGVIDRTTPLIENLNELFKNEPLFNFSNKEENNGHAKPEDAEMKTIDRSQLESLQEEPNANAQFNYRMYNYQNQAVPGDTESLPDTLPATNQPSTSAAPEAPEEPHGYDFDEDPQAKSQKNNLRHRKPRKPRRKTVEDEPEANWFKCKICNFKSKHKASLGRHMMLHKDPSEVKWYNCDICPYKSNRRGNLEKHELIHKNSLGVDWFKCGSCSFKAKQKRRLKMHVMLKHKNVVQTQSKWYKCDLCDYKAKYKRNLRKHESVH
ncbi:hypothetical protein NQ315_007432 [Exocentrus adspersus]|uniref:C2H2-type domain-containing protein n=1 Tax=Exocentrus adspersus TaxID=1586481 RepID=A0AAV8VIA6_9CUCU|nr:hypothetical protein NQ315_007432 [Exocentrus adspersus]